MYFILPRFEAIFHDFGVELPEITKFLIRWSHLAVDFFFVPVLLGFVLGVCFVGSMFTGGGMYIPLIDRLLGRRHTILILRCLVLFVEAEQPMSSALDLLAHWYPTNWVRRKLSKASSDVSHGHDWIDSLHSWRLLTASDVGLLNSAQRAGNLAWALRELVATSERRWSFRLQALMQLVFIGSMMILGAFVFLLAVAYFAPLTTLILRLS
jgi:type II secretory pathway component PulF